MIFKTVENISSFLVSRRSIFAVKQQAMLEIYGQDCDFWFQTDAAGRNSLLISRLSDTLTLCGQVSADMLPELQTFLECMGGVVEGDASLLEPLFPTLKPLSVLAAPGQFPLPPFPREIHITQPDKLAPVYNLLCTADAGFETNAKYEPWLADFSHRCRHGHAQCFVLCEENELIGTFSILFQTENQALGGAFAVHPNRRRQGYGSLLLCGAAAAAKEQGRQLYVLADAKRSPYYLQRGWQPYGLAAQFRGWPDE